MQPAKARLGGSERIGAVLLAMFAAWALARAILAGTWLDGAPAYLVSPLGLAAGIWLGRYWLSRRTRREAALVVLALAGLVVLNLIIDPGAGGGPLGYANANAALTVQIAGLAGVLAARTRAWVLALGVGLIMLAAPLAMRSIGGVAAAGLLLPGLVIAVIGASQRVSRWLAWLGAAAGTTVIGSVSLGVVWLAQLERWPALAYATLDQSRQMLWSEALTMWQRAPIAGMGPGSFAEFSSLARDPDTATAHSSLLQVGAETGWVGVGLLAAVVVAGFVVAARSPGPAAVVAVAAWTALWTQSLADHIVDFPAVLVGSGALLGWAGAASNSEEFDVTHREHP